MAPERVQRLITEALAHVHFCLILYEIQRSSGRLFLHEHPATATSWKDPKVYEYVEKKDVWTTVMHMCQYGMVSERDDGTWGPVCKPTRWMSNCQGILNRLSQRCTRGRRDHVHLVGVRAEQRQCTRQSYVYKYSKVFEIMPDSWRRLEHVTCQLRRRVRRVQMWMLATVMSQAN
jgi:hypothetical protein